MLMILVTIMLGLSACCLLAMGYYYRRQPYVMLTRLDYIKLSVSGVIAFIADAFGVGSFAVSVALSRLLGTFEDEELPGAVNGAQVLPGVLESIFFMQLVEVDLTTLLVLVAGTCVGGVLGGVTVSYFNRQAIRLVMVFCFSALLLLLAGYQTGWMPLGGDAMSLAGTKLVIGFFAMLLCGALTSAGVGLFVMIQSVLFLMNVSPEVAFPIMTTAGAMQQPLTTMVFVKQGKIPLKKTLVVSFAGCIGVLIALPVFNYLSDSALRTLLMFVLVYNVISMGRAYWRSHVVEKLQKTALTEEPTADSNTGNYSCEIGQ